MEIRSSLFIPDGDKFECAEFVDQSTSIERVLFDWTLEWHNHDTLLGFLSIVGRSRWNQRLFSLSYVDIEQSSRNEDMPCFLLLVYSSVPSERIMIAFSSISTFEVHLPSGIDPTFSLSLIISVRDTRDSITEWNLTSIVVQPDSAALDDLINELENPSSGSTKNPFTQLLIKGNVNQVGQVITSLSQQLNEMNTRNVQETVLSNLFFRRRTKVDRSI